MKKLLTILTLTTALVGTETAFAEILEWDPGFQVRLRGIAVVPDEDAEITPFGGSVRIDEAVVPEVDFTFFFNDHIAAELIAATAKHEVEWTVGPTDLGAVWLLPPTLLLQYHIAPGQPVQPYVGIGVNYTFFYNLTEPDGLDLDYDDGFGWAHRPFDFVLRGRRDQFRCNV
ncbi:MAG: OmpW family outer membrane protein, partial [Pseudomonadota bacterium]